MASIVVNASDWWEEVNNSVVWQNRIFYTLVRLYGFVAVVALMNLTGLWTCPREVFYYRSYSKRPLPWPVRALVFLFRRNVQRIKPEIFQHHVLDLPSLLFFTTYALLVLFWAEIYYQAHAVSTNGLRPCFYTINVVVYAIQVAASMQKEI